MDTILNLQIFDNVIDEYFGRKQFNEFCRDIDFLDQYGTPVDPFTEAVHDERHRFKKSVGDTVRNTVDTTRDVARAYGNITDANAGLIKNTWNLLSKAVDIAVKASAFIINKISGIPNAVLDATAWVMKVPEKLRLRVNHNIELYLTINDIELLYNKSLLVDIDTYITNASELSKGETWAVSKGGIVGWVTRLASGEKMSPTDIKRIQKMNDLYIQMQSVKFEKETVAVSNPDIAKKYFSVEKAVNFTDLKGLQHNSYYLDALVALAKHLDTKKSELKVIQESLGAKYDKSLASADFTKLTKEHQNLVTNSIQQLSKVMSIVGNLIKCVLEDADTIKKESVRILNENQ